MIQIENTPNPNALKFQSEKQLSEVDTQEFKKQDLNQIKNEFVKNILNFEGVELVLISKNFMSVKKDEKTSCLSCVCPKSGRLLVLEASDDFIGRGYSFRVVER